MAESLPLAEARRVALAAQGFTGSHRGARPGWKRMEAALRRLHLLQIDSVNVVTRAHYLPLYSRLGPYAQAMLDERSFGQTKRALFECWAHEASLLPLDLHPLMRWRMARARAGEGTYQQMNRFGRQERRYLREVLEFVIRTGPTGASDVPGGGKAEGGWWGWSRGKLALETLFDQGLLTAATRRGFERLYDVPERVIPADILDLPTPGEADAIRQLMALSAEALGIATEADLRDYFRLPLAESRKALAELVEEGTLVSTAVEGWTQKAYLHREARLPKRAGGQALLSPFDPLVWERSRAERLFGFRYRLEIYTPANRRIHGYYVLPFLEGERLTARVCLKADRQAGLLRVNAAHAEREADAAETARALMAELRLMAGWLGLERPVISRRGNLARALSAAAQRPA
ncbi:winged helix-turn-helix domain-containing protein [Aestuariivirga sp.]|jgi:uncharacterized protein YcaQ|uniref:winged helix-turn-helix domain-containing protein n=1 Tax=Aestuariivirga sp. TaxID=2650926 RepID=UPI0037850B4B